MTWTTAWIGARAAWAVSGAMITEYPLEHRRYDAGNTARVYHFDVARVTVPA